MKKKILFEQKINNSIGNGHITINKIHLLESLLINENLQFVQWPLGSPTVDFYYQICNNNIDRKTLDRFQDITTNFSLNNLNSIHEILYIILKLLDNGDYMIQLYQDLSEEIHFHFDRLEYHDNTNKNSLINDFMMLWWNQHGLTLRKDSYDDNLINYNTNQYYSHWEEEYSYYLATQSLSTINEGRTTFFMNQLESGQTPLILILDHNKILDGHHKAIAYSLSNVKPLFLSIEKLDKYSSLKKSMDMLDRILSKKQIQHFRQILTKYVNQYPNNFIA